MKKSTQLLLVVGLLALGCAAGCSAGEPEMTKAQEDAIRHPTKDTNWKGPDQQAYSKMSQDIQAYRERHKNDKVEFKTGG